MELLIDPAKKGRLQKKIAKSNKVAYVITLISKILLWGGLIGGGLYVLVNFMVPTLSLVRVRGVLQKDTSFILITSSLIFAPTLIFSLALNVLAKNIAGVHSSSRVDETFLITDELMTYAFRVKHQSLPCERHVIKVKLSELKNVVYDENTGALVFNGRIIKEFYDDYAKQTPIHTDVEDELLLFDYFSPSLKELLNTKGVKINN